MGDQMEQINSVLIVGATGSIGYWVVDEAVKQGFQVSALVRDIHRAHFDKSVHLFFNVFSEILIWFLSGDIVYFSSFEVICIFLEIS